MSVTIEYIKYKNTPHIYITIIKTRFSYLKKGGKIKYLGDMTEK